ncbi:MAG: hypothetical protein DCC49_12785 [Acidobacteria bacterium]|nr:MAG: hypothetical protein DCC49_12785 [Acidobacteriota bacterium]
MESLAYLLLIIAMTIAAGAMAISALRRSARGQVEVGRCPACGALTSRAYRACTACGEDIARGR